LKRDIVPSVGKPYNQYDIDLNRALRAGYSSLELICFPLVDFQWRD